MPITDAMKATEKAVLDKEKPNQKAAEPPDELGAKPRAARCVRQSPENRSGISNFRALGRLCASQILLENKQWIRLDAVRSRSDKCVFRADRASFFSAALKRFGGRLLVRNRQKINAVPAADSVFVSVGFRAETTYRSQFDALLPIQQACAPAACSSLFQ
jgi:hypothetical protein